MSRKKDKIRPLKTQPIYALDRTALERLGLDVSALGPKVIANLHAILGAQHSSAKDRNTAIANWVKIQNLNLAAMRYDNDLEEKVAPTSFQINITEEPFTETIVENLDEPCPAKSHSETPDNPASDVPVAEIMPIQPRPQ